MNMYLFRMKGIDACQRYDVKMAISVTSYVCTFMLSPVGAFLIIV